MYFVWFILFCVLSLNFQQCCEPRLWLTLMISPYLFAYHTIAMAAMKIYTGSKIEDCDLIFCFKLRCNSNSIFNCMLKIICQGQKQYQQCSKTVTSVETNVNKNTFYKVYFIGNNFVNKYVCSNHKTLTYLFSDKYLCFNPTITL